MDNIKCPECGVPSMPIQAEFSNRNGGIASAVSATTEQAVATLLATKHFELEDGLTKIFRINKKVTEMSVGEPASLDSHSDQCT